MKVKSLVFLAACASFVILSSAHADDESDKEKARQHYQLAKTYFAMERYQEAAREYLSAYEIIPKPELLYNVAQAYRLDGNHEQALLYYRRYLKLVPSGELAENARRYIDNLVHESPSRGHEAVGQGNGGANNAAADGGAARPPDASSPLQTSTTLTGNSGTITDQNLATAKQPADSTNAHTQDQPRTDDVVQTNGSSGSLGVSTNPSDTGMTSHSQGSRVRTIISFATIGAGVAALGLGAKYGFDARGLSSDIEKTTMWTPETLAYFDRGDAANTRAIVLLSVGTVAVAGGLVLYFTSRSSKSKEASTQITVAPLFGPSGQVGIGMSGSL